MTLQPFTMLVLTLFHASNHIFKSFLFAFKTLILWTLLFQPPGNCQGMEWLKPDGQRGCSTGVEQFTCDLKMASLYPAATGTGSRKERRKVFFRVLLEPPGDDLKLKPDGQQC
jgi:hypothetical protein